MICAAVLIGLLGIILAAILLPLIGAAWGQGPIVGIALLYCGLIAVVIIGVLSALHQRLKELEGGEEELAKKY